MGEYVRRVKTGSGATAVQIVSKTRGVRSIIEHIGSAHTDLELEFMVQTAKTRIRERAQATGQTELQIDTPADPAGPRITMQHSYSRVLYDTLVSVYDRLGFTDAVNDRVFRDLVIARIIEPSSKLDTIRILDNLGLKAPSYSGIHRSLNQAAKGNYRDKFSAACVAFRGTEHLTLVLYDVTTLFFYVEQEDEYRKPGLSKERRLEPQIVLGLLVDEHGFPLQLHSFEGNTAETLTLVPVLDRFRAQHPEVTVSVVCDAGMLSAANLLALETAGYSFIVGSRIAKTPPEVTEYQHDGSELCDGQVFECRQWFGQGERRRERRVVYQYREKRARLDLRNIEKQLEKAKKVVAGTTPVKKSRFVKISGAAKSIDQVLVESARQRAGIKGYVTNLPVLTVSALRVIDAYHQLFNVEASFRMAKTDLKARPIYHRHREKIEAHLTVVFCAIAVSRHIQEATGVSVKKFVQQLARVQDGVIRIEGVEHIVPAAIPAEVRELLTRLGDSGAGH
ncbi:IS1634 family transposase [Lysinibacter sp. HNR]|uniref:IS1634 family transposase n=1 Tax=Lysinibacter sp. HNR TaxID=3031408 RepID=UPI0024358AC3|nr:IS1634 family transposase [Lysinibacter sp. HNR]WGD36674.1 IS1634 family transposase [Lysinibacter sp. HNR]WGD36913.1 IS1634 family transposase [Lysinibacter sp. HNR]WGD37142.1 IS1634 family transposase [Lysinibacter sp. HNR]WGD38312.1 IS1634 family transposase [Lysinibacter sp. HNR]WGD38442.1 IS1634 family transposase [Lysinibacter sp. HNR]